MRNTEIVHVEITTDDGKVLVWDGNDAVKWGKAMNFALFMLQNHGMNTNVPKPTTTRDDKASQR